MDNLLAAACDFLGANGFGDRHLPPPLQSWLDSLEGRTFVEGCCDIFRRVDSHAAGGRDGEALAWMVRCAQLQLREIAPKVI